MKYDALGMIETKGLVGSIEAADAMVKAPCCVFQNADKLSSIAFASVNRTGRLSENFLPPVIVDCIEA